MGYRLSFGHEFRPGHERLSGLIIFGIVFCMTLKSLTEEAVNLSPKERACLIEYLWESLANPEQRVREAAWSKESEERIDAVDTGDLPKVDGPSVLGQVRKSLRR